MDHANTIRRTFAHRMCNIDCRGRLQEPQIRDIMEERQMLVKKTIIGEVILSKGLLDIYIPPKELSSRWKNWKATLDLKTCPECISRHGKIYATGEMPDIEPPIHWNCRCVIEPLHAVIAGNATKDGNNGADWWLAHYGRLPEYYITYEEIYAIGWRIGKSPAKYAPNRMISMGIYLNKDGHLPNAPGRTWYEADINYYSGKRNAHRILWSNDGLVFVTYDHYQTFMEII